MAFTAKDVQRLRELTGVGMMDCKKALTESDGDFDKAVEFLREKGLAAAQKKASRIAAEGLVYAYVADNGSAAIVEVNSETDFVAKNAVFQQFVTDVAKVALTSNASSVEDLMTKSFPGTDGDVAAALQEKILTIGENLKIRRFEIIDGAEDVANVDYLHMGGKIGVLVSMKLSGICKCEAKVTELGKDIAMQIAAMRPSYLDKSEVPAEIIEKEKEILLAQINEDPKNANKPDNIKEKMIVGRISKYYEENCLIQQAFVKGDKESVADHIASVAKELGGSIELIKYVRYEKGEGLEKREDNFADEVAKMTK